METRRTFLKKSSLTLVATQVPLTGCSKSIAYGNPLKVRPKTAAVVWYSQTGNTERTGRLIAKTLEKQGIQTESGDYRSFQKATLGTVDIVIAGSPVYYYDVPSNFQRWLNTIPHLNGASVASYVTFGGEGGNQYNTSRTLAELLADKGGVPVGAAEFGNMSTFAITWSSGNAKRVLKYKNKPDTISFDAVRNYTAQVLSRIRGGNQFDIDKEFDFREMIKSGPSIWGTKLFINEHRIDKEKCIECGTCLEKCPVGAISLDSGSVDQDTCIACLGCVNNCPAKAVDMAFLRKKVYGFNDFLKQHAITISEPEEFNNQTI